MEGRFEILDELGTGGMGKVMRARDRVADRVIALKMPHGIGLEPDQIDRFLREGEIMASLDHPGIVRVFDCGHADGKPYLVCELVEDARTLDELAELPLQRQVEIVRDVARALGYAHGKGVIHRDLKPDNILIDADGRVRVTDFGLARAAELDRLTQTGMHMGTPGYMPPELYRNAKASGPFSDTWAMGAILYEIVSGGAAPFPAANLMEMARRVQRPPEPIDDAPPALEAILKRALSVEPQARYPDGEALARDLDAYLSGGGEKKASGSLAVPCAIAALFGLLALAGALVVAILIYARA